MAESRTDTPRAIGDRVALIRRAYSAVQKRPKDMGQSEFARLCGIGIQALNNVEAGQNRIGLDNAIAICRRTGTTLDYIYFGDTANLPHAMAIEIQRLEKTDRASPSRARR